LTPSLLTRALPLVMRSAGSSALEVCQRDP
jgi:hypothetical protein